MHQQYQQVAVAALADASQALPASRRVLRRRQPEPSRQVDTGRGTPQGSVVSPMLANVYLHYVLDLWVARVWRPKRVRGEMYIVRYADDCAPRRRARRAEVLRAAMVRKRWREALRSRRAGVSG